MIDLNDVWQPPPRLDLREVRERLCATAAEWLPLLFPQARLSPDRKTLRCADLLGRPPRKEGSCIIHLKGPRAGRAYDHATGESAGPIDLIYHATGLANCALFEEAARLARMGRPLPPRAPTSAKPDHALEVARILAGCQPVAGTAGEAYLVCRGLNDSACEDLKFHPDLTDFETRRGWPGLVAIVRDGTGQPTGGIHRTYLLDDGSAKASPGKKMLGPVAGGSVRLAQIGEDGHVGITEGSVGEPYLRHPHLGSTLRRWCAALAMAGRSEARNHIRRCQRSGSANSCDTRGTPDTRWNRQHQLVAALWR